MPDCGSDPSARRAALAATARRLLAELGPGGAPFVEPELCLEIVTTVSEDLAAAIETRTAAGTATLEDLVDALMDAVLEACRPWSDVLALVHSALDEMTDPVEWGRVVGAWTRAVERTLARAQARGLVDPAIDPGLTALVLRDALDRTARSAMRFEFADAREATAAFMIAALRPHTGRPASTG